MGHPAIQRIGNSSLGKRSGDGADPPCPYGEGAVRLASGSAEYLIAVPTCGREDIVSAATQLRRQMKQDGMVVAPGAFDCITARMVEQVGFSAVYMTGA